MSGNTGHFEFRKPSGMSNVAWIAMNNRVSAARAKLDPEVEAAKASGKNAANVDAIIAARLEKDRMAAPPNIGSDGKPIAGRGRRKTRSTRARKTRRNRKTRRRRS